MITYRTMTHADIPSGLILCRAAGWNQLSRDWELFLQLNPAGCIVGVDEAGNVIGTVTTLPYQHHFSWVGMVLVHPSRRHKGIGQQLLAQALLLTKDHDTVKLDATPAGRKIYLKLNFVDEYQIIRMRADPAATSGAPRLARPLDEKDFPLLFELDRKVFGADRQRLLESNFKASPQIAFVVEEHGRIKGYCLGRPGYDFNQIGPIVADDWNVATQLLNGALNQAHDKPVVLDVMTHSPQWMAFVSAAGFTPMRPLTRMYRGLNRFPGIPEKQFAILGPEFG